jgi:flagellar biosynthesis regulator FlaF
MRSLAATTAYRRSATYRSTRQQESELFRSVSSALHKAQTANAVTVAKALADNELLWITVMDLVRDPSNPLPVNTRAAILSVGHAARREMASPNPDLAFLAGLNEQIADGLDVYRPAISGEAVRQP